MGWGSSESIIERRREEIGVNPRATLRALREDLRSETLKPRERARLLSLVVACHRELGNRDQVEATLAEARAVPKAGRIARLEIATQECEAMLQWAHEGKETWEMAQACVVALLHETERLSRRDPKTAWGRRQERSRCAVRVYALVARGQVGLFTGDLDTALKYGFEGMREAPPFPKGGYIPEYILRIHRGVMSLLAATLVRGGRGDILEEGVALLQQLIESLPHNEVLTRSCLAALLACAQVQRGRCERAADLFVYAFKMLEDLEASSSFSFVMDMWKWSEEHMRAQAKRVQKYLAHRQAPRR